MSKFVKITVAVFFLFLTLTFLKLTFPLLPNININDVEVGFSHGRTANKIVMTAIEEAKISIDIAAYTFTSKPIALALVNAQNRGVYIRVVADKKSNTGKYTAVTYLVSHHIPVRLNDKYAIMHNKFMIIDSHSIETGSFNYTKNAASNNAENVIYLRNQPDIAKKYTKEFNKLWNESEYIKYKY